VVEHAAKPPPRLAKEKNAAIDIKNTSMLESVGNIWDDSRGPSAASGSKTRRSASSPLPLKNLTMSKRKNRFYRRTKPGAPPGTIIGENADGTSIHVIGYSENDVKEHDCHSFADVKRIAEDYQVVWVNVIGLGNVGLLHEFAKLFNIHHLTLEDVVNVHQRAKSEKFEHYHYTVTRMVAQVETVDSEQISIFQSGKFVFTFQERAGDCLETLRMRIREGKGFIRRKGSDYLVYAILDTVFDHYFPVVDWIGEQLDEQDEALMEDADFSLQDIHRLRSHLLELRRWLRPNRELLNQLIRDESPHISDDTKVFLRDCYDHVIQLQESIESYREVCSDLRDYHLSAVSNRTNEVMKTLTIVSTIFIPLSFLAGLYGMNFETMPELRWKYGYFALLTVMASIAIGFFVWFRRKGWF
jgi:magnesium transporter